LLGIKKGYAKWAGLPVSIALVGVGDLVEKDNHC
jgi:hypothetical protein